MPVLSTHGAIAALGFGFGAQTFVSGNNYTWVFTNSSGNFTVPSGVTSLTVEGIGAGGQNSTTGGAGGGGAYAKSVITVTPGQTIYYNVGNSGSDSWVNKSANSAPGTSSDGIYVTGGGSATTTTGANGGSAASSIGQIKYSGGKGGNAGSVTNSNGGGGGAAGPTGNGGDGGNGTSTGTRAGGGGGGAGGASTTAGTNGTSAVGGAGGIGPLGDAGGVGATSTTIAGGGTNGSGGGGGAASAPYYTGAYSSQYDYWGAGFGPAGGTGGPSINTSSVGAKYGAGAAGNTTPQNGGAGLVAITFNFSTPSSYQTVSVGRSTTGNTSNIILEPYLAGVDNTGNCYFAATNSSDWFVIQTSSTGKVNWSRKFGTNSNVYVFAAICDNSYNIYIAGSDNTGTGTNFIAKYNSSGVLQWQKTITYTGNAANNIQLGKLAIDSSGNIWLCGANRGASFFVMHKITSSGTVTASYYFYPLGSSYQLSQNSQDNYVAADSSGNIYVTWQENWTAGCCTYFQAIRIAKINSSGVVQWAIGDSNNNSGSSGTYSTSTIGITIDSSSNVYWGRYGLGRNYCLFSKFDSTGTHLWSYNISSIITSYYVQPNMVIDSSSNNYAILWDSSNSIFATLKLNSSGSNQFYKGTTNIQSGPTTNSFVNSNVLYQGMSNGAMTYMQYPTTGLTAGNYGLYNVSDITPSTNTTNYTSSSTPPTIQTTTYAVSSASYVDAAASFTTLVGWL